VGIALAAAPNGSLNDMAALSLQCASYDVCFEGLRNAALVFTEAMFQEVPHHDAAKGVGAQALSIL